MYLYFFTIVGAITVLKRVIDLLWSPVLYGYGVLRDILVPTTLSQKFGSWAVVTGSTDGIGKQYAIELARRGINVVLISRNPDKLKRVAGEIETLYGVKTKIIVADFSKGTVVYPHIKTELQDIPVGILVNNVGVATEHPMKLCEEPLSKKWEQIQVNVMPVVTMTDLILPQMLQRRRGAIVNVASAASLSPWLPYAAVYGATKAFIRHFTLSIQREYTDSGVHIQLLTPSFVTTNMLNFADTLAKSNFFVPLAKTYAKHAILTLGKLGDTCGYWPHGMKMYVYQILPESLKLACHNALVSYVIKDYEQTNAKRRNE